MNKITLERIKPNQIEAFRIKHLAPYIKELDSLQGTDCTSEIDMLDYDDYEKFLKRTDGREAYYFNLEGESNPIGFCFIYNQKKKNVPYTHISHFCVFKEYRNKEMKGFWQNYAEECAVAVFKKSHKNISLVYYNQNKHAAAFWQKVSNIYDMSDSPFFDVGNSETQIKFKTMLSEKDDRTPAD